MQSELYTEQNRSLSYFHDPTSHTAGQIRQHQVPESGQDCSQSFYHQNLSTAVPQTKCADGYSRKSYFRPTFSEPYMVSAPQHHTNIQHSQHQHHPKALLRQTCSRPNTFQSANAATRQAQNHGGPDGLPKNIASFRDTASVYSGPALAQDCLEDVKVGNCFAFSLQGSSALQESISQSSSVTDSQCDQSAHSIASPNTERLFDQPPRPPPHNSFATVYGQHQAYHRRLSCPPQEVFISTTPRGQKVDYSSGATLGLESAPISECPSYNSASQSNKKQFSVPSTTVSCHYSCREDRDPHYEQEVDCDLRGDAVLQNCGDGPEKQGAFASQDIRLSEQFDFAGPPSNATFSAAPDAIPALGQSDFNHSVPLTDGDIEYALLSADIDTSTIALGAFF